MRVGNSILGGFAAAALFLCSGFSSGAQQLASLPADSKIVTGELPNGITYHLCANDSKKGFADFALVRKGPVDPFEARYSLAGLPGFYESAPFEFLARHGIGYDRDGYIRYEGDATIYNFRDVPVTSVLDTTLLMIFNIIDRHPETQDIVIAGDISTSAVVERMKVLSMMVPQRTPAPEPRKYVWEPELERPVLVSADGVRATYKSPRTPVDKMNTAQPVVTRKFSIELGIIAKNRIERALLSAGVPFGRVSVTHTNSSQTPGDELYEFYIETASENGSQAARVLGAELSDLCRNGASVAEYQEARNELMSNADLILGGTAGEDSTIVRRCVASYLYGSSLASAETVKGFFTSKAMKIETETSLFNNFVAAIVDRTTNLTLSVPSASDAKSFDEGWKNAEISDDVKVIDFPDTLGLKTTPYKFKLKRSVSEPISGGELWTFSNGIKVVYKRNTNLKGRFAYSLMIRGGGSMLADMTAEQQSKLPEMVFCNNIAGLSNYAFHRMLTCNGIVMNPEVSPVALSLSGTSPSSKLGLLLKSLLSITGARQPQSDDEFTLKAENYFTSQFSHVSDGYIILVGDLESDNVKKLLMQSVAGFSVNKAPVTRNGIPEMPASGVLLETRTGGPESILAERTALVPFTTERLLALRLASMVARRALVGSLAPLGWSIDVKYSYELMPVEAMKLKARLIPAKEDGLPDGISPNNPEEALAALRTALKTMAANDKELSGLKAIVLAELKADMNNPEFIVSCVQARYSVGKDLVTNYADKLGSISVGDVNAVLSAIAEAGGKDIIISK
ncbi:MAG: hypothetical protein K5984_05070 [Bacteroidales bacterium]|nr:hypothetical protein [Bacteroidales bacterium]